MSQSKAVDVDCRLGGPSWPVPPKRAAGVGCLLPVVRVTLWAANGRVPVGFWGPARVSPRVPLDTGPGEPNSLQAYQARVRQPPDFTSDSGRFCRPAGLVSDKPWVLDPLVSCLTSHSDPIPDLFRREVTGWGHGQKASRGVAPNAADLAHGLRSARAVFSPHSAPSVEGDPCADPVRG
jgi:hypothetical protein